MADQDYVGFSIRIPVALLERVEKRKTELRRSKNWVITEAIAHGLPHVSNDTGPAPQEGSSVGRQKEPGYPLLEVQQVKRFAARKPRAVLPQAA